MIWRGRFVVVVVKMAVDIHVCICKGVAASFFFLFCYGIEIEHLTAYMAVELVNVMYGWVLPWWC